MNVSIKGELEDRVKSTSKRLVLTPRQLVIEALESYLGKKKGSYKDAEVRVNGFNESNRGNEQLGTSF